MSLGPPPSASTLEEVRHQVSRHALVSYRCLWTLLRELSTQPRGRHTSGSPAVTALALLLPPGHQPRNVPVGLRAGGSREIPALNKQMSKDLSSRGIWGTSHSASSAKQGHSSFQLIEDSSRLATKDTGVLHPQKSEEAVAVFSQAWFPSSAGTW